MAFFPVRIRIRIKIKWSRSTDDNLALILFNDVKILFFPLKIVLNWWKKETIKQLYRATNVRKKNEFILYFFLTRQKKNFKNEDTPESSC